MNVPNIPQNLTKNLNRTLIVLAIVSVVVILLFLGGRQTTAQTQMTERPTAIPQQSTLPPMPNYIDVRSTPKPPTQAKAGKIVTSKPDCRENDMACIEQRNRLKTGGSDVDPDFVR